MQWTAGVQVSSPGVIIIQKANTSLTSLDLRQAEPFELQAETSTDHSRKVSVEPLAEASIKTPVEASSETPHNALVA